MTTTLENLAPGVAGTLRTLEVMAAAARGDIGPDYCGWRSETVRRFALQAIGNAETKREQIDRIFRRVRDGIRYVDDPYDTELVQDACVTIELQRGDCDDKVELLATALLSLNLYPRFIVHWNGVEFTHVLLEVYEPDSGMWLLCDPTGDGRGNRPLYELGQTQQANASARYDLFTGEHDMADYEQSGMGDLEFGWPSYLTPFPGTQGSPDDSGAPWWADSVNRSIDTLGAWASRSPYVSPDDPRYQGRNYPTLDYQRGRAAEDTAIARANTSGTQFNIPWWGWVAGGAVLFSFLAGKRSGR